MEPVSENNDALLQKAEAFMDLLGVEGVAISESNGKPCLLIFNSLPAAQYAGKIPQYFEGLPVVFQDSSIISAQDDELNA